MTPEHYIQWIELTSEDDTFVQRKMLTPDSAPEAIFKTDAGKVVAREYCNLHGLWKA
jgi:superoxide reductase